MSDQHDEIPSEAPVVRGAADDGAADAGARSGELLSRLRLIEDQPLETRAEAYAHVHDELRAALDEADRQGGR